MTHHLSSPQILALCNSQSGIAIGSMIALAFEGGTLPEWVQLFPAGPDISARDGRKWRLDNAGQVIAAFDAHGADLPIDINHATEIKVPKGEEAPAAGWMKEIALRDGALCARVEWTQLGRDSLAGKTYHYLSPAFLHDAAGQITSLRSAALVTSPALHLPALAGLQNPNLNPEIPMKYTKALCAALGLPANFVDTDVSEAHLIEAINAAKTPALASFVPRADLELALASRATAEQALATYLKTQRETAVAALLDGAVKDGKVAPASRAHYEALCSTDAGFAEVQKLVAAQPSFFKQEANAGNVNGQHMALTTEERRVVAAMGLSEKDFLETKALQTA